MIDCRYCEHYFVTYEKNAPHGCRGMGFKTRQMPSAVVFANSGRDCLLYRKKTIKRPKKKDDSFGISTKA